MPTPFHINSGGGGGATSTNGNNVNLDSDIERDDPTKLFVELTEIGHGNFGAVYYVTHHIYSFDGFDLLILDFYLILRPKMLKTTKLLRLKK